MASPLVAVEFDLYDGAALQTLRLWNGSAHGRALTAARDGEPVQFDPRLSASIEIGSQIAVEEYGQPARGAAKTGTIEFAIDEDMWPWLDYHWKGRACRIYEGEIGDSFDDLTLAFVGRIADLTFDTDSPKASVQITDTQLDFDKPLVTDLYPDDAIASLRGRPKPWLRGTVYSAEPILEDEPSQTYRLSWGANLDDVLETRVGGVPWEEVVGAAVAAQWASDLPTGTFVLGSKSLGHDVRCDVRAVGYEGVHSAALISEIVTVAGGSVDSASLDAFAAAVPGLIGVYRGGDPINMLDLRDDIVFGAGGWSYFGNDGALRVGVIEAPAETASLALDEVTILNLQLVGILAPAWRVRTEYRRNWHPLTNALSGVTDADAKSMGSGGIVAPAFEDESIKTAEPRALDVPLIRTLFVDEADVIEVRDRLAEAYGVERRLYTVTCRLDNDDVPQIYDTVSVGYQMVAGNFRVLAVNRAIGGGPVTLRLWGSNAATFFIDPLLPDVSGAATLAGAAVLTFDQTADLTAVEAGALAGEISLVFTPAGVFSGNAALAGAAALTFSCSLDSDSGDSLVQEFSIENTSGSTMASGGYYTAYIGLPPGALPPGNHIEIRRNDGTTVVDKFQTDLFVEHADGSVGTAINFKDTQSIAGGSALTFKAYNVAGAADNTSALTTSDVTSNSDFKIECVIGGVTYVTKVNDYINNATNTRVLASGPNCKDWDIRAPLRDTDGAGTPHPQIWAWFHVRLHEDGVTFRVWAQVVNGYVDDTTSISVTSLAFKDGGTTIWSTGAYTHYRQAKQACVDSDGLPYWSANEPTFFTSYTPDDMAAARLLWRLDQSAGLKTAIGSPGSSTYGIQTSGGLTFDQDSTGPSHFIGMIPSWDAKAYVMQREASGADWAAFARTEAMGSLAAPVHWYNSANFNLYVFDGETYSGMTGSTTLGWGYAPTLTLSGEALYYAVNASHYPNWCYYQFITTGDPWWLDEVQAHTVSIVGVGDPDTSYYARNPTLNGNSYNGFLGCSQQIRSVAWALRQLGDANWVTPDADVAKAYLTNLLTLNIAGYEDLLIDQHDNNTSGSGGVGQDILGWMDLGSDYNIPALWQHNMLMMVVSLEIARGTWSVSSRFVTDHLERWVLGAVINGCAYNALPCYHVAWWQGSGPYVAQPIATDWDDVYVDVGDVLFTLKLIPGGGCPGSGLNPAAGYPYDGGYSFPAINHAGAYAAEDVAIVGASTVRAYLDAEDGGASDAEWAVAPQWYIRP